jgi:glyoxylase-like metal-dependent hydrolase (beta-lactamase superfamily II)
VTPRAAIEEVVESRGAPVWRIVSPMVTPLEPVNVYVLRAGEGLVLVDTGIRSKRSMAALRDAFAAIDARVEDVRHVVLTHPHVDHVGLARAVVSQSGATVWAHPDAARALAEPLRAVDPGDHPAGPFFRRLGVPEELAVQLVGVENYMLGHMQEPVTVDRTLQGGDVLSLPPFELRVIETHGHCPGHIMLHEPRLGLVACGDHLHRERLPVCPIALYPPGAPSLEALLEQNLRDAWLDSVHHGAALDGTLHLPGHGPCFDALDAIHAACVEKVERRARAVLEAAREPVDVYALSRVLFGDATQVLTLLTTSETLYCVAELLRAGALHRRDGGDAVRFVAAGPFTLPSRWAALPGASTIR